MRARTQQNLRMRRSGWNAQIEPLEERELMTTATYQVVNNWGSGLTGQIQISNTDPAPLRNWRLEFDFTPKIDSIWNGVVVSHTGNHYVVSGSPWGLDIPASGSISFGFNASPGSLGTDGSPTNWMLNGQPLSGPSTTLPTISVNDLSVTEGDPGTGIPASPTGFMHTVGNQILDSNNQSVRLAGVNWFGLETSTFAPHGLWARGYKAMMDQMKQLGFNTIRLPYSNQLFDSSSKPNGIDFSKNPDLQGLNGLGIIDKIVTYAGQIGMKIFLDHHRSTAGNSAQESGLWYTPEYPESRWISDWVMLAQRYKSNPTVIGADLHNEPHGQATWGSGNAATDWRLAAQKAGNAILAVNPDWLIMVEGVEFVNNDSYWWGGNLSAAGQYPVVLNVPGRLVYSVHDYPQSVYNQSWFSAPNYPDNLTSVWDQRWGYLYKQNIAPVLVGEFGSKMTTASDLQWANRMVAYLKGDPSLSGSMPVSAGQQGPSWTWWSWNPNSGDTGGILKDDWTTVNTNKVELLQPIKFAFPTTGTGNSTISSANFTIKLSGASTSPVTVSYRTANGTATSGSDYSETSGILTFAPGEISKVVSVPIAPDKVAEPDETFTIQLSNPSGSTLAKPIGTATILNDDGPQSIPAPSLKISDASLAPTSSGTSLMVFDVQLSSASNLPVIVNYSTSDGSAKSPGNYQSVTGTLNFTPGVTRMSISVPIVGTSVASPALTFKLQLANPVNAIIGNTVATGTILAVVAPPIASPVKFTVKDKWASGFVSEVGLSNTTTQPWSSWTLEFDLAANITNIWNGQILSHIGNRYIVKNLAYNGTVAKGGSTNFGFQASATTVPGGLTNVILNGKSI